MAIFVLSLFCPISLEKKLLCFKFTQIHQCSYFAVTKMKNNLSVLNPFSFKFTMVARVIGYTRLKFLNTHAVHMYTIHVQYRTYVGVRIDSPTAR